MGAGWRRKPADRVLGLASLETAFNCRMVLAGILPALLPPPPPHSRRERDGDWCGDGECGGKGSGGDHGMCGSVCDSCDGGGGGGGGEMKQYCSER